MAADPLPHKVGTSHIRSMLADALRLAGLAENPTVGLGDLDYEQQAASLEGAAMLARHAAAELEDELFRLRHPGVLRT